MGWSGLGAFGVFAFASTFFFAGVEQKCRYYINHWSEPRFFRYSSGLTWEDEKEGYPLEIRSARVYPVRIKLKHFPYRSPEQIQKRLQTRRPAVENGEFIHESIPNWGKVVEGIRSDQARGLDQVGPEHAGAAWEERIVDSSTLDYDAHDGTYVLNEALMPPLPRGRSPVRRAARRLILSVESIASRRT